MQSPRLIILMGVAGSGKSTLGRLLATRLAYTFLDADDLHCPAAIACMRSGKALDDAMRDAWVDRLVAALKDIRRQGLDCVLACSGLRACHRRQLMQLDFDTRAFMLEGQPSLLAQRLVQRENHFMPPMQLDDQLAAMEPVKPDERIEHIAIDHPPRDIVAAMMKRLEN